MTANALATRRAFGRFDGVLLSILAALAVLALWSPGQALRSLMFTVESLVSISIYLLLSIGIAAYAKASGADALIARAFAGRQTVMIAMAALMGALSPFCSCGVIPLIAALLVMGVPLPPVMAFWLSSPLMDPSMFVLTMGTLGADFALFKTAAAVAIGLFGGYGTQALMGLGAFAAPLRAGVGDGGCAGGTVRQAGPIAWRFWDSEERRARFGRNAWDNTLFLGKWLTVAFFLESLMLAYLPAETVSGLIGGGWLAVAGATIVGVPAYLNGYAALPLVGGLIEQGMAPGAGMAFLLAGGVSSIPAAIAVWALARPPMFAAYLGFAFIGAFSLGLLYGMIA